MNSQNNKSFVIKKTAQMSFWALVSRVMGIAREILQARFLGVSDISDAFFMASGVPNMLRKIFEEGGITSALVPHLVRVVHDGGKKRASNLVGAVLLIFEFLMLLCCVGVWFFSEQVVVFFAPGFSPERVAATIPFLRIMFTSGLFFSGSSILASGLQSVHHFFIPAMGPAIYNSVYLVGIGVCLWYALPPQVLAIVMVAAGAVKFASRLLAYFWYGFSLHWPSAESAYDLSVVMRRFLPCLLNFGALEISILLDRRLTSFLPKGSVTLLYYAQRFSMLPYSMLAVALATVLLSHFSVTALKNPKRLTFFLLESAKLATWFALPLMAIMMFIATPLFADLMLVGRATPEEIGIAARLLTVLLCAFPFQVLNKIMTSIFYAKNDTATPMWVVVVSMLLATGCNYWLIDSLGIFALTVGLIASTVIKSLLLGGLLWLKHQIAWPVQKFLHFVWLFVFQFLFGICVYAVLYLGASSLLARSLFAPFFSIGMPGYWMLIVGVFCVAMTVLWLTHRAFRLRLYLMPHH